MQKEKIISKGNTNWAVQSVVPNSDFTLTLTFKDGIRRLFDTKPFHALPALSKLARPSFFKKAHVKYHTVIWDENTDIDPEVLYQQSQPVRDK